MAEAKAPQPAARPDGGGTGTPVNPYRNYNYRISVTPGDIRGHFTRCEGLGMRIQPIRYCEGGMNGRVRQLVGPLDYSEVRLDYGIISGDQSSLWNWLDTNRRTHRDQRNVMIDLLGPEPADVYGYVLEEAWICEWKMHPLDSLGREFAVETISFAYESISRASGAR
jgi:phage tail-like protein